jgi:antitoxin VapB
LRWPAIFRPPLQPSKNFASRSFRVIRNPRPYERDPARTSNKLSAITSALAIKRYGYRPDGRFCTDGGNCIYLYHGGKAKHLNIKSNQARKLATELAELTGESLTTAVTLALRERLARERRRPDRVAARLMKIGSQYAALPDTGRSPDEILGCDDP